MKYKPGSLDMALSYIEKAPPELKKELIQAIKDELQRILNGDYTEQEKALFHSAQELGLAVSKNMETIALEAFYRDLDHQKEYMIDEGDLLVSELYGRK